MGPEKQENKREIRKTSILWTGKVPHLDIRTLSHMTQCELSQLIKKPKVFKISAKIIGEIRSAQWGQRNKKIREK